jgi:hypothetical protein
VFSTLSLYDADPESHTVLRAWASVINCSLPKLQLLLTAQLLTVRGSGATTDDGATEQASGNGIQCYPWSNVSPTVMPQSCRTEISQWVRAECLGFWGFQVCRISAIVTNVSLRRATIRSVTNTLWKVIRPAACAGHEGICLVEAGFTRA